MGRADGTCSKCGLARDGAHQSYCKACQSAYARKQREDPVKAKAAYLAQIAWKKRNPEKWQKMRKGYRLKYEFGISLHDFEKMLEAQDNLCANEACRGPLTPWPHLDHDHATGKVREILCHHCNLAIGNVKDDPERAEGIAAYLRKHSEEG